MKKIVYTRYDNVGKFYNALQVADTNDVEEFLETNRRACVRITDQAQIAFIKDISLFNVGIFDDTTGKISLLPEPVKLIDCVDWLGGNNGDICKEN